MLITMDATLCSKVESGNQIRSVLHRAGLKVQSVIPVDFDSRTLAVPGQEIYCNFAFLRSLSNQQDTMYDIKSRNLTLNISYIEVDCLQFLDDSTTGFGTVSKTTWRFWPVSRFASQRFLEVANIYFIE